MLLPVLLLLVLLLCCVVCLIVLLALDLSYTQRQVSPFQCATLWSFLMERGLRNGFDVACDVIEDKVTFFGSNNIGQYVPQCDEEDKKQSLSCYNVMAQQDIVGVLPVMVKLQNQNNLDFGKALIQIVKSSMVFFLLFFIIYLCI